MLAYENVDASDEYFRLNESTMLKYLKGFVVVICTCFEFEFLRHSTRNDIQKLIEINNA